MSLRNIIKKNAFSDTNEPLVSKDYIVDEMEVFNEGDSTNSAEEELDDGNDENTSVAGVASDELDGDLEDSKKGVDQLELTSGIINAFKKALEDGVLTIDEYTGKVKKALDKLFKSIDDEVWEVAIKKLNKSTKTVVLDALETNEKHKEDGSETEIPDESEEGSEEKEDEF